MKVCEEETVKLFFVSQQKNERQQTQVREWKNLSIKKKGGCPTTVIKHWPALPRETVEYPPLGDTQNLTRKGTKQHAFIVWTLTRSLN